MFYVYVLESEDEKRDFYLGYSSDLKRRLAEHNSPENRDSTGNRKWRLVYYESYTTEEAARSREYSLKRNRRMKTLLYERIRKHLQ